ALTYRGRLVDAAGAPVADGNQFIQFTLWDSPTAGTELWNSGIRIIAITDGLFSYNLGSNVSLPASLFLSNASLYLGITVGTDAEISPRTALTSSAFAYQSLHADSAQFALDAALLDGKDAAQFAPGDHAHIASGGSVFTHWGSRSAPSGSTLLYSGFGYASFYSHGGNQTPIILNTGDPGPTNNYQGGLLYPLSIAEVISTPPGIAANVFLQGSVCFSEKPTFVLWGGNTPPPGWTVLYQGYAMGPHYTHAGSYGPLCIDTVDFDASATSIPSSAFLYSIRVQLGASGDESLQG
ncbi:MAG: hypothetical protein IH914_05130, partial [candidate division Zixibacteria bacterium]|nr:hypothetical protein [candidate division Zixibacteria bacterium]